MAVETQRSLLVGVLFLVLAFSHALSFDLQYTPGLKDLYSVSASVAAIAVGFIATAKTTVHAVVARQPDWHESKAEVFRRLMSCSNLATKSSFGGAVLSLIGVFCEHVAYRPLSTLVFLLWSFTCGLAINICYFGVMSLLEVTDLGP